MFREVKTVGDEWIIININQICYIKKQEGEFSCVLHMSNGAEIEIRQNDYFEIFSDVAKQKTWSNASLEMDKIIKGNI